MAPSSNFFDVSKIKTTFTSIGLNLSKEVFKKFAIQMSNFVMCLNNFGQNTQCVMASDQIHRFIIVRPSRTRKKIVILF